MAKFRARVVRRKPRYKQAIRSMEADVRSVIGRAANLVRNTAIESIQRGSKTGIVYVKQNPNRTHQSSAPGEAPATDTGFLVSNIVVTIDTDGMGANVESRAEYSKALEFGTSEMAARPFLIPALNENRGKIRDLYKQTVRF